jgi:hypothetical protein
MRPLRVNPFLAPILIAILAALPALPNEAKGAGGFSGGTFRGGGGYVQGPRGGAVAESPWGGTAVRAPDGAVAVRTPGGNVAVRAPSGGLVYRGTTGAVVAALPYGAMVVAVDGRNLYFADGIYYEPCYVGDDINYCEADVSE